MTTVAITTIHSVFIRGLLSRATGPVGADLPTFRLERTSAAGAMQMHYRPLGSSGARHAPGSDRDGDQSAGRRCRAFVLLRDGRRRGGLRRLALDGRALGDLVPGDPLDDRVDLFAVEGLLLEENLRDLFECGAVLDDDLLPALVRRHDDAVDLVVDLPRGVLGVVGLPREVAAEEDLSLGPAEGHRPQLAHAPLAHHAPRHLGGLLEVVRGARRDASDADFLGEAAARDDRDLVERVRVLLEGGDERVAALVIRGDTLLLFRHDHGLPLGAHEDLVLGVVEVDHVDFLLVDAGGRERGLVHEVREVGSGEARRAPRHDRKVDVVGHRDRARVDLEDAFAALHVRTVHDDAAVEAAGAKERGVENVGTIRGRHEDDPVVAFESVHFDEERVQRLFALVVSAAEARAAVPAYGVDLVDEDDAGGVLLALFEEIADARRAHAHEHLDEVGAGDREERHVRFAGDGAREERLAGARGAHHDDALRDLAAELLELRGLLQEVDDLGELFLGLFAACDVLERGLFLVRREELRARFSELHRAVPARLHLPHDEN